MSLSISTTGAGSNSVKPMAISSITSPPLPKASLVDSQQQKVQHMNSRQSFSSYPSAAPSPPESPTYQNSSNQQQQQHYTHHQHHNHRHSIPYYYTSNNNSLGGHGLQRTSSMSSLQAPPLSLQERRQRNKAASAKYRAKKNQQHGEMRSMILSLTKENDLLQRQLDHIRHENGRLKATCDRLRGKMLAEKMLKKLLNSNRGPEEEEDDEDDLMDENYSISENDHYPQHMQYKNDEHAAMLKRFDEDIDFDDEEEYDDEE